ncbi:hypothetical protein D3C71_2068970 [compost metagenome]
MQTRHQPRRTQPFLPVTLVYLAKNAGIRIGLQKRRLDALNAPAFLIDQNRGIRPRDGIAH